MADWSLAWGVYVTHIGVLLPALSQKTIASAVHHLMRVCVYVRVTVHECVCAFLHCPKHSHCHVRMHIQHDPAQKKNK